MSLTKKLKRIGVGALVGSVIILGANLYSGKTEAGTLLGHSHLYGAGKNNKMSTEKYNFGGGEVAVKDFGGVSIFAARNSIEGVLKERRSDPHSFDETGVEAFAGASLFRDKEVTPYLSINFGFSKIADETFYFLKKQGVKNISSTNKFLGISLGASYFQKNDSVFTVGYQLLHTSTASRISFRDGFIRHGPTINWLVKF
jgi:hypothetical protein